MTRIKTYITCDSPSKIPSANINTALMTVEFVVSKVTSIWGCSGRKKLNNYLTQKDIKICLTNLEELQEIISIILNKKFSYLKSKITYFLLLKSV